MLQAPNHDKQSRLFTLPLVLFLILFLGFPLVADLVYSVSRVTFENLRSPELQGFKNFVDVVNDPLFWKATHFSFKFGFVTALIECSLGLFLAVYLAPLLKKHPWLMAILMMPMMAAPALVGLMYRLVLHEFVGPVPFYLWEWFGDSPAFLDANNAIYTLMTIEILQWTPFAVLLFHVAYQAIPEDVRKAATLDGAHGLKLFWNIELPFMKLALFTALFVRFIDGFRVFDNVYVLTGSGAGGSTTSLSIYVYLAFFKQGNIGKAVAASMLLLFVTFAVLFALNYFSSKKKGAQ
ncbi:ABC transporter permease [Vibrio sp. vnigr-6D03]|uniref:ABC transporter permease n=1 Tax=Vibrio penaeicida TaxID=104609 RepID=A0AAV5NPJ4_9VIBR|nr:MULTISPECIES: sugar ABC transporter permease [Vibrio]MDP2573583.1 sugar ABC transporter permease [Vibrio penaeicida]PKF81194.1 ABC transporter permease [Vibrio sp. vnigr-6D03]RTZ23400.1 sugar ABC transporter permease [Vibrio penaeicida]GLQ72254.1 ABC transporter permease [Vibrio penaeicida]